MLLLDELSVYQADLGAARKIGFPFLAAVLSDDARLVEAVPLSRLAYESLRRCV